MSDPLIESAKEIEALRERVAELTADVSFWNTTFLEAREGYEKELTAMTQERDAYRSVAEGEPLDAYQAVCEQLAAMTQELNEWERGERQYPQAVQDYKDLCVELKRTQFDLAAMTQERDAYRSVAEGEPLDAYQAVCEQLDAMTQARDNLAILLDNWKVSQGVTEEQLAAYLAEQEPVAWTGCGECDCSFPCHEGEVRCIRLSPLPEPAPKEASFHDVAEFYKESPAVCAAPSSEEVREIISDLWAMIETINQGHHAADHHDAITATQAADLIERLAARVTSPEQKPPAN